MSGYNGPLSERLFLAVAIVLSLITLGAGVYLSYRTADLHWMNRAGAAIVTVQALVIIIEFRRRDRLQALFFGKLLATLTRLKDQEMDESRELKALVFLEGEIRKAESHVMFVAVVLAMIGELLHGFGDLLMKVLIGHA